VRITWNSDCVIRHISYVLKKNNFPGNSICDQLPARSARKKRFGLDCIRFARSSIVIEMLESVFGNRVERNIDFFQKNTTHQFFCFFKKPFFLKEIGFRCFLRKTQKPILNCFYCIMR